MSEPIPMPLPTGESELNRAARIVLTRMGKEVDRTPMPVFQLVLKGMRLIPRLRPDVREAMEEQINQVAWSDLPEAEQEELAFLEGDQDLQDLLDDPEGISPQQAVASVCQAIENKVTADGDQTFLDLY